MEIKKRPTAQYLFLSFAILLLTECKKDTANSAGSIDLPVVQGYLIPGTSPAVNLYQQKSLTDTAKYGAPITGQQVYISDGSTKVLLTESPAGTYTYNNPAFLVAGKTYMLQFKYLTYSVTASTLMPAKPANFTTAGPTVELSTTGPSTGVLDRLAWDNPDSLNHVLVFLNADEKDFPVNSFGRSTQPYNFTINTDRSSYYNITQNIFPYLGPYTIILFSVNQEYIDLLNSNTNSATSSTLNNVPTNIVNGFGIFTAMQADTVSLNVF
jgi:hypothetical protein